MEIIYSFIKPKLINHQVVTRVHFFVLRAGTGAVWEETRCQMAPPPSHSLSPAPCLVSRAVPPVKDNSVEIAVSGKSPTLSKTLMCAQQIMKIHVLHGNQLFLE